MADDRMSADRGRAIEAALANIEKRFGKGSIMRLGEREVSDIPAISTTSLSLDAAIGVGGVPRGRIIEIYGPESSGKTTLALHIVAEAQKAGGVAAYIDAEHAMDADYAGKLGVRHRSAADFSARFRRTGARDCRSAGSFQWRRRDRDRLGRGARAARRTRRRNGRFVAGSCRRV